MIQRQKITLTVYIIPYMREVKVMKNGEAAVVISHKRY